MVYRLVAFEGSLICTVPLTIKITCVTMSRCHVMRLPIKISTYLVLCRSRLRQSVMAGIAGPAWCCRRTQRKRAGLHNAGTGNADKHTLSRHLHGCRNCNCIVQHCNRRNITGNSSQVVKMLNEKELIIRPMVQESVQHNARVSFMTLKNEHSWSRYHPPRLRR
jgi:hypothetical protein